MAQFRTCFSSICESGYKIDLVKSGMQKYLRRREAQKMKWCMCEIYKFKFGNNENERKIGKGIISNLVNRIIVMLDEELCFDEVVRYSLVYDLLEDMKKTENYEEGVEIISKICDILCSGNIIRLSSDIVGYFNKRIFEYKLEVCDSDMESDTLGVFKGENAEIEKNMRNFIGHFNAKNSNCYYWLFKIYNMCSDGVKTRYRRKEYIYAVWQYLEGLIGDNKLLRKAWSNRINMFYEKNKNERKMFLVAVVNVFMYRDVIDFEKVIKCEDSGMLELEGKFVFDDYCIDMHCKDGRIAGKNRKDFALEGCLVINEYEKYKVDEWREYYINEKINNEIVKKNKTVNKKNEKIEVNEKNKKKEITGLDLLNELEFIDMNNFKFIKLCSNTTCGNKVMCFVVEYEGNLYVLKEGRKSMNYNVDYEMVDKCKEIFGLNAIGMRRIKSNKIIEKINKNIKSWNDNWQFVDKDSVVYSMMTYIEGEKLIDYRKKNDKVDKELWLEFMKIGLFRGIFMVSDFSQINVMFCNNKLYSIDEHDALGKRKEMIGMKNMKVYINYYEEMEKIFEDLFENQKNKMIELRRIMLDYNYDIKSIKKVTNNYQNLKDRFNAEYIKHK